MGRRHELTDLRDFFHNRDWGAKTYYGRENFYHPVRISFISQEDLFYIFINFMWGKKSSIQGLNFCPSTGTSTTWCFPLLTLPPTGTFCNFFSAIENLSPPTAGSPHQICFSSYFYRLTPLFWQENLYNPAITVKNADIVQIL